MKKLFLPYEISIKLKKLGFDESCFCWYNFYAVDILEHGYNRNSDGWLQGNHCSAPLYQQVLDWLRENHNIHIEIQTFGDKETSLTYRYWLVNIQKSNRLDLALLECSDESTSKEYTSYYEALNDGIIKQTNILLNDNI